MTPSRWGPEGPPPDAYGRVTEPERFSPLHDIVTGLLDELEAAFDAERSEGYGLDAELEGRAAALARPTIRISTKSADAAAVAFVFTAFPGVIARFGRWHIESFPMCGCDACAETLDEERRRLRVTVENVTAGRFREAIQLPPIGDAWKSYELWSPAGRSAGKSRIDRAHARRSLGDDGRSSYDWAPWPRQ